MSRVHYIRFFFLVTDTSIYINFLLGEGGNTFRVHYISFFH